MTSIGKHTCLRVSLCCSVHGLKTGTVRVSVRFVNRLFTGWNEFRDLSFDETGILEGLPAYLRFYLFNLILMADYQCLTVYLHWASPQTSGKLEAPLAIHSWAWKPLHLRSDLFLHLHKGKFPLRVGFKTFPRCDLTVLYLNMWSQRKWLICSWWRCSAAAWLRIFIDSWPQECKGLVAKNVSKSFLCNIFTTVILSRKELKFVHLWSKYLLI